MKPNKLIFWTPRILSIIFILFLAMLSLDIFDENYGFWETILGLFMHNIPTIILLIVLIISWIYEIVGGIGFILAGFLFIALFAPNFIKNGFEWMELLGLAPIIGICWLIGILFLLNWFKKV